jgi:hypothetical protein
LPVPVEPLLAGPPPLPAKMPLDDELVIAGGKATHCPLWHSSPVGHTAPSQTLTHIPALQ